MRIFRAEPGGAKADIRIDIDDTTIQGISPEIDELINERFRKMTKAILQLQDRTLVEPIAVEPFRAYDGQIELADGENWSPDGSGEPGLYYYWKGEWISLADEQDSKSYMEWRNTWTIGANYRRGDVVYDNGWLVCANKATTDRAAPVVIGAPEQDLPNTPAWAEQQFLGVAWTGTEYVLNKGGWIQSVEVWVPELSDDTFYRILLVNATDPDNLVVTTIENPVLRENEWTSTIVGATPVAGGSTFLVILDALNSGGTSQVTGGWAYEGEQNAAEPATGQWNRRTQDDVLRINYTDLDAGDRTSELDGIIAGSDIQLVATDNPNQSITYHVDAVSPGPNAAIYTVTRSNTGIAGEPSAGDTCTMTATVPVPQSTKYVELANYWPGNQPAFAATSGLARLGGVEQTVPDNAYGVRLTFQEADVSEDWDLMAYTDIAAATTVSQDLIDNITGMLS